MRKLDLAVITGNQNFWARAEALARSFHFESLHFTGDEDFYLRSEDFNSIAAVLVDCCSLQKASEISGTMQVTRQLHPDSYILTVLNSKLTADEADLISKSGASLVVMESEYYTNSKTEFALSQVIRSTYIPIKTVDLQEGSIVPLDLLYLMPMNRKFLKVAKSGTKIHGDFLRKYDEAGELYFHRRDLPHWISYSSRSLQAAEQSLRRQCRSKFLQLNQSFLELILLISDQSTGTSFARGRDLYETCRKFVSELQAAMASVPDPWSTISNSSIGDFGSVERLPTIAAYAGILSAQNSIGSPEEVMIGAMLSDVGYLELSPSIMQKMRNNRLEDLNSEERMEYEKHPIFGLRSCLARKLPLTESIKNMVMLSHERADQRGFPNRVRPEKLTEEAMLIRLCWELDSQSQIRMGEKKVTIEEAKRLQLESLAKDSGNYSYAFSGKMNRSLLGEPPVAGSYQI